MSCDRAFVSHAALILHWESGACRSGVTRQILDGTVTNLDRYNIITNPDRLICDSNGPGRTTIWASERCWNGHSYECYLCHREFSTLHALNSHVQSPAHDESTYRCPPRWGGCDQEFVTLSGLFQHVESECCGVQRFQRNVNSAIGSLTGGMMMIGY